MDLPERLLAHPDDPKQHELQFGRCDGCRLQSRICMCEHIPKLSISTQLQLIIHFKETKRPTNTGLLAAKCLENSRVLLRGKPGEDLGQEPFDFEGYQPVLLFPNAKAKTLTPELVKSWDKPVSLIVPDGNWNQASRMPRRIKQLDSVPTVILPDGPPTRYRLRREKRRPEGLATMEAIIRTLVLLGHPEVEGPMLNVFEMMVTRALWSKGILSNQEAFDFLPKT